MGVSTIPYRVGIQQRILPVYRAPFFESFGSVCAGGLSIFSGLPMLGEAVEVISRVKGVSLSSAYNIHIMRGMTYLCWQRGIIHWLEEWKPEVLIVEANPRYLATPAAVKWMKRRDLPVIGWGLGAPRAYSFKFLRTFLRKNFYTKFDAMIAYSYQGAEQYVRMGVPADRVFTARNAVTFRPQEPPPLRSETFELKKPVILCVGRLVDRKRIDLLIDACSEMGEIQPELWVVGDGPHRATLETLAHRVYPETRFFGSVYGTELDQIFDQADCFVLPGTGGLAVQQAMSHALPVIVAEADGTQNDLVSPANGWIVPPGNLPVLVETLKSALADPVRLRKMGLASYRVVSDEINLENMVEGFLQAIRAVMQEKR